MKKKGLTIIALVGTIIALVGAIFLSYVLLRENREVSNETATNEIRIGAILPLTGNSSLAAKQTQEGIQLAVDSINSIVGGKKIKIIYEDSKSDVETAISAYRHLESKGINTYLVHGGQFVMGIAPLTKGSTKILAAVSTPNPDAIRVTDRLVRFSPLVEKTVNLLSQYVVDSLQAKKGAIIYVNNNAYQLYNDLFVSKFSELKGEIVFSEGCPSNKRDFKNTILKIGRAKPDFVFVASIGEQVGIITNQILQNPMLSGIPIIGNMNMGNPSVKESVQSNGAFIRYADVKIAPFFYDMYEKKYGTKPNSLSAQAYSAIMVLYKSMCKSLDSDEQLEFIKCSCFNTAVTPLSFEETGECNLEMMIYDF